MNDRIKLLAEQATKHFPKTGASGEFWVVDEEKFAELIVRECCRYLDHEAERLYTLSGSEQDPVFQSNFEICAEKCYDNIQGLKEHFGVE
jgi:hypothetical protein